MRILLTTDTVGGVWDYTRILAESLCAAGHKVLLAVLGDAAADRRGPLPSCVEVAARPYRLEWMPDSAADVEASTAWIEELALEWRPVVVHLNQYSPALGNFAAPTLLVSHSDVFSWFSETLASPAPAEWSEYHDRVRSALRRATLVIAPSQYQSRLLARHYGFAADQVIANGIAPPDPDHQERRSPLVVSVGRAWDSAKGIRTLDKAADELGEDAPPIHLLGPCTSPQGEHLETKHIVCHGTADRASVDAWLGRATIYVGPSLYEPFGLAPLEAALHGCALVLSDIGSFRELWDGCAEFFPPGDSGRLAAILSSLRRDETRVRRLAEAARRRALERYTADRMAREYQGIYAALAPDRPLPGSTRSVHQPV
ncbi:MAG TPA: glycosyltransferase family 4 protein [Longimicrobiaceae bacterium]